MVAESITVRREAAVAIVTLDRPQVRNAITLAMWRELAGIFQALDADPETRAVILTGAGGNFSVGADVTEFATLRSDIAQSTAYEVAVDACSEAIANIRKPTFCVISGYCLGGGCHVSMACDFRFIDRSASVGIPAARLSIVYGIRSMQRLYALVGSVNAKRMLFSADRYDAQQTLAMGLADELHENAFEAAMRFSTKLASNAPLSIAGAKYIINGLAMGPGALDLDAAQARIDQASNSADYLEGRRAFAERRAPDFRGR